MKTSSIIKQVEWMVGDLYVNLGKGFFYKYADVPESVYKDFMAAESLGKFFTKEIKGKYTETKYEEVFYTTQPVSFPTGTKP